MKIKEINDKSVWDSFIIKVAPFAFFQSWNWGEVERENGHKVLRWGVYENGKLVACTQTIEVYAKRGSYFHIRHGPVFKEWEKKYVSGLVNFLGRQANKHGLAFIRVSPLINAQLAEPLQEIGFRNAPIHNMDAEVSYLIDLRKNIEDVLMSMRKNTRNLIRKAEKIQQLEVKSGLDSKMINDFLCLFRATAKRRRFIFERGIEKELKVFSKDNQAEIIMTYYEGRPAAGALIVYSGNQGIYRYAASSAIGRNIPATYLVQWTAIQKTSARGLDFYNLWGGVANVQDTSHPWYGITLFKRGFGGEKREYIHALDLPLSYIYWKTYFLETAIKYIRGYEKIGGFRSPPFLRYLFGV